MIILRYLNFLLTFANILTVMTVIIYLFLNGKKSVLLYSFILSIFGVGLLFTSWLAYEAIDFLKITVPHLTSIVDIMNFLPWCFTYISFFIFFMSYAGRNIHSLGYRLLIAVMFLLSLVDFLSFLQIGLVSSWDTIAKAFVKPNLLMSYLATIYGLVVFIRSFIQKHWPSNKFLIFGFFSAVFSLVLIDSFSNFAVPTKYANFNFTINAIRISLIDGILWILAMITFRYRLLNIIPLAYRNIVASMSEGIMVLDPENRVITVNDAFKTLFPETFREDAENQLETMLPQMMESVEYNEKAKISRKLIDKENIHYQETIQCLRPSLKYFDLKIRPVTSPKGKTLGRVLTWNDVTRYWELNIELNEKNKKLTATNEHLKEHAEVVQELAASKERDRIAKDMHDILGHTLTVLITTLEVCRNQCPGAQPELIVRLTNATRIARDGLSEVRNLVSSLATEENKQQSDLLELLQKVARDIQAIGIDLEIAYDPTLPQLPPAISYNIYRVCKESLTNSLRHGKATRVDIILKQTPQGIQVYILDNGAGCKNIKPGHGMEGLRQRIAEIGGDISFYSDGEQGFGVKLEINLDKTGWNAGSGS